jgi:hypothetical protein
MLALIWSFNPKPLAWCRKTPEVSDPEEFIGLEGSYLEELRNMASSASFPILLRSAFGLKLTWLPPFDCVSRKEHPEG